MAGNVIAFRNCRLCRQGKLIEGESLIYSTTTGVILDASSLGDAQIVDLNNLIVSPGFIELQTNGLRGFHFTHFEDKQAYDRNIDDVARYLTQTGVTGFYATIPTVRRDEFQKIIPRLKPRDIRAGACLLGAHAEGPYLHPSKHGAHNASLFESCSTPPGEIYGEAALSNETLKLVTIAPDLDEMEQLIGTLVHNGTRISLGHSSASYQQGLAACKAGASCLTHTLNAMAPLHHRDPGLAGLVTARTCNMKASPYFSIISDGYHLHPSVAAMLAKSSPDKCIVITDSIELAGMPDGTYPGHSQIPFNQTKKGSKVVIEGTETLVGGCAGLDECVRNLMTWSGWDVAMVVRTVTENVVNFMGDQQRGKLEPGRKADFVVLDDELRILQTWIDGRKVWEQT